MVDQGIYYIPRSDSPAQSSIQFFDFANEKFKPIARTEKREFSVLSVSLDDRWILYSQIDQAGSDLMLVENFT